LSIRWLQPLTPVEGFLIEGEKQCYFSTWFLGQKPLLDDQATAKGQRVVVTGTLDAPHNTIHVRKIEAVA